MLPGVIRQHLPKLFVRHNIHTSILPSPYLGCSSDNNGALFMVAADQVIMCQEVESLVLCLGQEHPVKGIIM